MSSSNSDVSLQDYLVNSHNNIHNRIQAQNKPQQHQQQQQNIAQKENRLNQQQQQQHHQSDTSPRSGMKKSPQKVAMFKNDVSVDNMVVEIEPDDLIPRKSGNVRAEYPWRVGGTAKRTFNQRKSLMDADTDNTDSKQESPSKKMRTILPKGSQPEQSQGATTSTATAGNNKSSVNQIMIPVTLKTPCKTCNKMITASSLQELKSHSCAGEVFTCTAADCGRKFNNKNSFQYHVKHCHNPVKKDIDIMSIATNELVTDLNKTGTAGYTTSIPVNQPLQGPPNKPFACPYEGCNKSYNVRNYLIQYERTHTGKI